MYLSLHYNFRDPRDEILEHELSVADRRNKKEVRHLEQELPKWQVLVDSVTGKIIANYFKTKASNA